MPERVEVPETVSCVAMVAFPPTVRLPESLIYVALSPARVVEAVFWVNAPRMVVEDMAVNTPLMVVEPVFDTEKKVEVAPVLTMRKRSANCPLALLITRGMELTGETPNAVVVASIVKTALVKGVPVPTAS